MQMPAKPHPKPRLRPPNLGPRVRREQRSIHAMLHLFCRDHHDPAPGELCPECTQLWTHVRARLDACALGEMKQPCGVCVSHCYGKGVRPRIAEVIDYAGPRLWRRHPVLGLRYWLERWRGG